MSVDRYKFFSALSAILLAVALVACRKEDEPAQEKTWSDGFSALMEAYFTGKYFDKVIKSDDFLRVTFTDGNNVSVPNSDVKSIDCTVFDFPEFGTNASGQWTINKVATAIKKNTSLASEDSMPVCIYFDEECIFIFMSNGETLIIGREPSQALTEFKILSSDNIGLDESIVCGISGFEVEGTRPSTLNNLNLVPRFTFRGKSIKVDGVEQVSGLSRQDFSEPVVYDIELYSGEVVSFTVKLKLSGSFPAVYIYTQGGTSIKDRHTWVTGSIRIEDPRNDYSSKSIVSGNMRIRGRGNSSWGNFPKKPYRIKLDEKASVFGLPKNKDWILLASYSDKTLLRDMTGMELSRICGLSWTPALFHVELYVNNQYQGVYLFGDHKEVANHRVDITVAGPSDNAGEAVTGGYYLEIEQNLDEAVCWTTQMGVPMMFKDPEKPTIAQQKYVKDYFNSFEKALSSSSFADPTNGYAAYIDVDSFINYYIVKELVKDIDGNLRKSTFLTKERGKKLEMYHVWDFDLTIGNCNYFDSAYGATNTYEGFFIKDYGAQGYGRGWYYKLFQDPAFRAKVKKRWNELKPELSQVPSFIDAKAKFVEPAATRNFRRWNILMTWVWPNLEVTGTYWGEVNYMKSYYSRRLSWLDSEINKW